VDLDQVQPVGAESAQALLDPGADVRGPVVVRVRRRGVPRQFQRAAALGGQEVLVSAVADMTADELLATALSIWPAASSVMAGPRGWPRSSIAP
jgi:hypothetical protein